MCPYKMVTSPKAKIPWITQEIYHAIRDKKALVKKYKIDNRERNLIALRRKRNYLNSLIDKAKSAYIQKSLNPTVKKPKKFWKLIKSLIDKDDCVDITSYIFTKNDSTPVDKDKTPDFLNDYFANIAQRTSGILNLNDHVYTTLYEDVLLILFHLICIFICKIWT